mmetsp:Transcript_9283/g.12515  ORF Transcript_9283/g.12515 Transcript_9283/m.12515 type:complete len:82 (+) Transcript_9283:219-464(+)
MNRDRGKLAHRTKIQTRLGALHKEVLRGVPMEERPGSFIVAAGTAAVFLFTHLMLTLTLVFALFRLYTLQWVGPERCGKGP